jgi:2-isopropylmalate synthase
VVEAVIAAGAATVNIPDTVGYAMPEQFGELIGILKRKTPNIARAVISVHCHNDLGLAVANSLAAVKAGARQVECTINGLGERAGNAALEELVMAIRSRSDYFGVTTGIETARLYPTSRLVANVTGMHVQRNKAIVGENAFAHESGVHQDGMLKERTTYEILKPADVGVERSLLVLGKHSGKHAFAAHLKELGFELGGEGLEDAFARFKVLCDRKKNVYDADLVALVEDHLGAVAPLWQMELLQVSSGNQGVATAAVALRKGKERFEGAGFGDGPVDAVTNAVDRITGQSGTILDFQVRSVTEGREAQGEVTMEVKFSDKTVVGRGVSTDIIEASAKAYLNAVSRVSILSAPAQDPPAPGTS